MADDNATTNLPSSNDDGVRPRAGTSGGATSDEADQPTSSSSQNEKKEDNNAR